MKRAFIWSRWSYAVLAASIPVLLASAIPPAHAAPVRSYETSYTNVARLTRDLTQALEPKERKQLHPTPLLLGQMPLPYLQHRTYPTEKGPITAVRLSSGFVDLVNGFSHAMAIDAGNGGYLKSYLSHLPLDDRSPPLRPISTDAWSPDTMNHQQSHFNQIAGTLIAVEMAEHYLGYHEKHAQKAGGDESVPLNRFLTHKEWRLAVLHGARNALDCGLGVDGIIRFYQAIDAMKVRPDWAEYFLPPTADVSKISRDLTKLESYFFAGRTFNY